jgi:hypothetical protein
MALDWEVEVHHTYKESNKYCADGLANMGCTLGYNIMLFDSCPSQLVELFTADNMRISTPRLVSL